MPFDDISLSDVAPEGVMSRREASWLCGLIGLACVVFLCGATMADPDLWGHTLYGLRTLEQGILVERHDPFSYTAPAAEWVNHEWLTETALGALWQTCGNAGLILWRNVMVCLLFAVFAAALRGTGTTVAGAVLLLVFTTECLANFVLFVRPQLATFVLFGVILLLMRRYWDHPSRMIWWCVPCTCLWANLHGGFLAGVAVAGLATFAAVCRGYRFPDRRADAWELSAVLAAMCLSTLVNPYGLRLHGMLWDHLVTEQCVREWQPLWASGHTIVYYVPFAMALLVMACSRRWQWIDLMILAAVAWQAASHLRHVSLLAITACILLPVPVSDVMSRAFSRICQQWGRRSAWPVRFGACLAVILVLLTLQVRGTRGMWRHGIAPWEIAVETRSAVPGIPARAVSVMRQLGLQGNLVTDYGWGQYALWQLYPDFRIAFDGRYRTVFPATVERDFLAFQQAGGTSESHRTPLLDDHPTQVALIPIDSRPDRYLKGRPDWKCLYRDDQAAVYVVECERFADPIKTCLESPPSTPALPAWITFPGGDFHGTALADGVASIADQRVFTLRTR